MVPWRYSLVMPRMPKHEQHQRHEGAGGVRGSRRRRPSRASPWAAARSGATSGTSVTTRMTMNRPRAVRVLRSLSSSARARAITAPCLVPAICRKSSSRLGCSVSSSWRATPWAWASVADLGGGGPAHREGVVQAVDGRAGGDERGLQLLGLRRAHATTGCVDAVSSLDGPLGQQPALAHDEDVVDGLLDLGQHVAGDEDGAALGWRACAGTCAATASPPGRGRWPARRG